MPAPVLAAIDVRLGVPGPVRLERARARRDVPELGILGIDRDRPRVVAVSAFVRGLPALAPVDAPGGTAAARLVRETLDPRVPGERVDITLRAGSVVLPRLAAVGRAHQTAELDPGQDDVPVVWAWSDPADVRRPRPRREAPGRLGRELEKCAELTPGLAAVVTAIERARLGPRVDGAVRRADREREDIWRRQAAVGPGAAAVGGAPDPAAAEARVDRLRISRIDSEALQRHLPPARARRSSRRPTSSSLATASPVAA